MKHKLFDFSIALIIGVIYCPLLMIGITDIMGTAKGMEYTIAEPELSAYREFGIIFLLLLVLIFVIIEWILKKKIYRNNVILFLMNIAITLATMIIVWPLFAL